MTYRALNRGNLTLPQVKCTERTYLIPEKLVGTPLLCTWCGGGENLKKCQKCHLASYCSTGCQRNHWRQGHRLECRDISQFPEQGKIAKRILSTLTSTLTFPVSDPYIQLMRALDALDGLRPYDIVIDCDDIPASSGEWRDEMAAQLSKKMKVELVRPVEEKSEKSENEFTRLKFRVGELFVYHVYSFEQNVYCSIEEFYRVNDLRAPVVKGEFDSARFLETLSILEKTIHEENQAVNRDQIAFLTCVRFALRLSMGDSIGPLDFALLEWMSRKGCNKQCPFVKSAMELGSKLMRREREIIDLTNGFDLTLSMLLHTIGDGVMDSGEILLFAYFYDMWL